MRFDRLIVQSDRRVGGYGYSIKKNADVALGNVKYLNDSAKEKEELVNQAMLTLEDCLYAE